MMMVDELRGRRRPRIGMFHKLTEGSYSLVKRKAEDLEAWRVWMPGTCLWHSTNE